MPFSSIDFLYCFLPLTLALYWISGRNRRNAIIAIASILFYYWTEKEYTAVLIAYIVINWAMGLMIDAKPRDGRSRFRLMILAVSLNIVGLIFFKYTNFILNNAHLAGGFTAITSAGIHLPIGISFFAFQGISYIVDVGKGGIKAATSLIDFAAYKAFFPQLIAGPIVRYKDVEGDFSANVKPSSLEVAEGIRRFAVGLGKKVLIANSLATPADAIFNAPANTLTSTMIMYGAVCYSLQLYFDFSGYSDMAIGLARIFGIRFRENFNYPYAASSIRDFWQRWHISLSTWFRDYLYIPLGGSRHGMARTIFNLWLVFLLCGFWHGAEWTFIAWGVWHGVFLGAEHLLLGRSNINRPLPLRVLLHLYTMSVVLIGWVIFRSANLAQAVDLLSGVAGIRETGVSELLWLDLANGQAIAALAAGIVGCTELPKRAAMVMNTGSRNLGAALTLSASTIVIASSSFNPFIYFRF